MESKFYILHNLNEDDQPEVFEVDRGEVEELLQLIFEKGNED